MTAKFVVGLLLCGSVFAAEPRVKQATGEVIRTKGKIQTGSSSRIELELPFSAIVRIGSNADFKFSLNAKQMSLAGGTMLLSLPEKVEGVSVEAGSVVTSVVQGDFEMSNVGGTVKVIGLNGKVTTALAANPSDKRRLRAGQMVNVPAGATSMPPVTAIKLATLLKTSILFNMGPLPTSRAIRQNATAQSPPRPFVTGGFDPDFNTGGLLSIGPAGTVAMISRMEANQPQPLPVIPPGEVPTQAQAELFVAEGVPIPSVSTAEGRRILRGDRLRVLREIRDRNRPPVPVATPVPTPAPRPTLPPRPANPLPIPRPTLRPPIAPP